MTDIEFELDEMSGYASEPDTETREVLRDIKEETHRMIAAGELLPPMKKPRKAKGEPELGRVIKRRKPSKGA